MRMWCVKTKIKGKGLATLPVDTRLAVNFGLHSVGDLLIAEFKKQVMSKRKHGEIYKIQGRLHRASAKYETPANVTGHYRDMVGFYVSNNNLTFGNNAAYAGFLEDGTRNMYPRYGLRNTLEKIKPLTVVNVLEKSIRAYIK